MRLSLIFIIFFTGCNKIILPSPQDNMKSEDLVALGIKSLRDDDLSRARSFFQTAYEMSGSAGSLDGLGSVALREEDIKIARYFFQSATEVQGSYAPAWAHLGFVSEAIESYNTVINFYQNALAIDPLNIEARNNMAAYIAENKGCSDSVKGLFIQAESSSEINNQTDIKIVQSNLKKCNNIKESL